ncbi:MAG TPA: hypothetical protein DDW30_00610 [Clostridiales bacterium]|nr:hypothetical protein [Clostridiales bacterium]
MKLALELITDICLNIAMATLLVGLIRRRGERIPCARLLSATVGLGFVFGTVAAGMRGINAFVIPDALGFILSYSAFLFTFPGKKAEGKNK